ncbi:thiamine phosphate synthase [Clostridium sp. D2Q-11]|uniref:Thiamine-phosphate synthase n=1 Tax=Anaeromonas frigoriresistens TaxID=2683708 RepID=A0A942Z7E3_9FIRM|nr:thiamine phosphate synthase [Anaeromonas frigoriresistens]MBS4538597.1 thiamine phosphate synthase [Anaeromonas frigoriresistens]
MNKNMIYVVTNRNLIKEENFYEAIERCSQASIDGLILREKDLSTDELLEMAKRVKVITNKYHIPLIINGNIEVAKKINSYGCHLSYKDIPNNYHKEGLKLGASIHSVEEAIESERLGVDYIIAGNIFETDCKPGLIGKGIEFLEEIKSRVSIPIIAIGGIDIDNAKKVINAGVNGVAIMSSAMNDINNRFINKLREEVEENI